jgi:hypothetical protein
MSLLKVVLVVIVDGGCRGSMRGEALHIQREVPNSGVSYITVVRVLGSIKKLAPNSVPHRLNLLPMLLPKTSATSMSAPAVIPPVRPFGLFPQSWHQFPHPQFT